MRFNYFIKQGLVADSLIFMFTMTFCLLMGNVVKAQSLATLKKEHKEDIKKLREDKGFSQVQIIVGDNGFWFYLVEKKVGKGKLYGVVKNDNSVLFNTDYNSITYINGIGQDGYSEYTFPSMTGGRDAFKLYNYSMPHHFILEKGEEKIIVSTDGEVLKQGIFSDIKYLGSWLICNASKIYTRNLNGFLKLMLVNMDSKNMGLLTWNGQEVFPNDNFLMTITSRLGRVYNNVYAYNNKSYMGAVYLENLGMIVPTVYSEIQALHDKKEFMVKVSPVDTFHVYKNDLKENFIPKNLGEEYFLSHKYEDCIKYYSEYGVDLPEAKLYVSSAMQALALNQIIILKNHNDFPARNKLNGYNYNEAKTLLINSTEILETAKIQDSIKTKQYDEVINNNNRYLADLDMQAQKMDDNSLVNVVFSKVLSGMVEGIKVAAVNSIKSMIVNDNNSDIHGKSYKGNSSNSSYNIGSSSSNENEKYRLEWLQRKSNAEKQLQYYQEKLKKDPNNAALKHNIKKQQENIRNAESML